MSKTNVNLVELAKQGNPEAIAVLVNRQLEPKGITTKIALKDNSLQIIVESSKLLQKHTIVELFRKSFTKLNPNGINTIKVYGKNSEQEVFDWYEVFDLVEQTPQELLELARKGNADSISKLINQQLQSQGIIAKISFKDFCLRVMLETQESPEKKSIVAILVKELDKLNIESLKKLIVYGKESHEEFPAWHEEINYDLPVYNSEETLESLALVPVNKTELQNNIDIVHSRNEDIDSVKLSNYLYYDILQTKIYEPLSLRLKAEENEHKIHAILNSFNVSNLEEDINLSVRQIEKKIVRTLEDNYNIILDPVQLYRIFSDSSNYEFTTLKNTINLLEIAIQEVLNFDFPEETDELEFFFKKGTANFIDGFLGMAPKEAMVGFVAGNLILPGLGGIIGSAVGWWFSDSREQKEHQKRIEIILERYDSSRKRLFKEWEILFKTSYEKICYLIYDLYKINLIKYDDFKESENAYNIGNDYFHKNEFTDAIIFYDRATNLNPRFALAWNNKGYCFRNLNQYEEAIYSYTEALKIDYKLIIALNNLMKVLDDLNKYDALLILCDEAISNGNNTFEVYCNKCFSLFFLAKYLEAIDNCNIVISSNPNIINSGYHGFQVYMSRCYSLFYLGKYPEAINDCNLLISIDSSSFSHWLLRSACFAFMGDSELALQNLKEAIKLAPEESRQAISNNPEFDSLRELINQQAEVFLNQGNAKLDVQDYQGAIFSFDQTINLQPNYYQAYFNRGLTHYNLGDYQAAILDYNQAINLQSDHPPIYFHRGIAYNELEDYQAAISDLDQAIKLQFDYAEAYLYRGISYGGLENYQAAILDLNQAIKLQPGYGEAYYVRGLIYYDKKDYQAAISDLDQAIKLQFDDYAEAYLYRGISYSRLENYQAAILDLSQAIKFQPGYGEAYYTRGLIYYDKKDYQAAISDLNQAIKLQFDYFYAYLYCGISYAELQDYQAAISDLNQAIKLKPNNAEAYYYRGNAYWNLGDNQAAISDYNQAINFNSDYAEAYRVRGLAYSTLGEYQAAISDYNQAINLNPDYAAYCYRGRAYYLLSDYQASVSDYNQAISLQPDYIDAYLYRGYSYKNQGNYKAAILDFEQVIRIQPDNADARENLALLYQKIGDSPWNLLSNFFK